jgi:hypothetical protein
MGWAIMAWAIMAWAIMAWGGPGIMDGCKSASCHQIYLATI